MLFDPPVGLRYTPDVETPETDEPETIRSLGETLHTISAKTFADGGHALRAVHAKAHGLLHAQLEVLAGLPPVLAQGLFARPARYPVAMRFSTLPGDLLHDSVSTPRGLALKVIGVEGARLPGSDDEVTQDFVLVNSPSFSAKNAKIFLANLKLLAATTDKGEGVKSALSAVFRGAERAIEAMGGKSAMVTTLGGQAATNILGETFFTQTPLRYGDYIAKLSLAPVSAELLALTDASIELKDHPDALREAVSAFFRRHTGVWELRAQICTDLGRMPVEDASAEWPQDKSPYITVARLVAQPQSSFDQARAAAMDDGLSFSPWHGLAAHQPLGSINRARRPTYAMSARFRAEHNGVATDEPRDAAALGS